MSGGSVGRAPGKVIVTGEHFVVHGARALAVPLHRYGVEVEVHRQAGAWSAEPSTAAHVRACLAVLEEPAESLRIAVRGDLPSGAGLGGSAALAVALIRALDPAAGGATVRERAHRCERLAHGTPSGIDDAVIAHGQAAVLEPGEGVRLLEGAPSLPFWVALVPERTATREAVAGVHALAAREPEAFADLVRASDETTGAAIEATLQGDRPRLGACLDRAHEQLQRIGVSLASLDALVQAARDAGAHGAKLTGGGLGGAMIALAPDGVDLGPALEAAGATHVMAPPGAP